MPQQVMIEMTPEVEQKLMELPTATTPGERQLTLHYLAAYWDGQGDVFENGPLLGGATRALAMGMMFNEKRDKSSRLRTYDWFSLAEPLDLADGTFEMLAQSDEALGPVIHAAFQLGTFRQVFKYLHARQNYSPLVKDYVGYLPGHPGQRAPDGAPTFRLRDDAGPFGICFIDGCKSWYGTKYWFQEVAPRLRPGTDIFFQDYGHYTCFWISSLVGLFHDCFELVAYVDHTYIWRLTEQLTFEDVRDRLPDEPDGLTRKEYDEIYDDLLDAAYERGDRYCVMIHQAHRAAAYAYIGLRDEAAEILNALLMTAEWFPYRGYLKNARYSPTYTPEAKILL